MQNAKGMLPIQKPRSLKKITVLAPKTGLESKAEDTLGQNGNVLSFRENWKTLILNIYFL